ncbi:MAG: pilus assembly protein, partial [Casimicrobiaceae bacterium]
MNLNSFTRWQASGLHLVLSVLIAATLVVLVLALWYPAPYFAAMGGATLLRLLIGVDVILGPLITLIIFDTRKPRLKWDLAAVG